MTCIFLKNSNSVNIFKIKIKLNKTKETKIRDLKKINIKNLIYVLIICAYVLSYKILINKRLKKLLKVEIVY